MEPERQGCGASCCKWRSCAFPRVGNGSKAKDCGSWGNGASGKPFFLPKNGQSGAQAAPARGFQALRWKEKWLIAPRSMLFLEGNG